LVADDAAPAIGQNIIDHNRTAGVVYRFGQGAGTLEENLLQANGAFGLQMSGHATPTVRNNTIVEHLRCGIHAYNGAAPILDRNVVSGNQCGVGNQLQSATGVYFGGKVGQPILMQNVVAGNVDGDLALDGGTRPAGPPPTFAAGGWFVLASGHAGWAGPPAGAAPLLPGPKLLAANRQPAPGSMEPGTVQGGDLKNICVVGEEFEDEFKYALAAKRDAEIPGKFLSRAFAELRVRDVDAKRLKAAREYWKQAQRAGEARAYASAYHDLDQFLRKYGI
jgi:hypothetical protein